MRDEPDSALLEACRKGDRKALETLVRYYQRPLFNAAYRMLGNADEAADVTQTTFLKAIEKLDRYKPEYRFFSWIYRIAINEAINQLNRRRGQEELHDNLVSPQPGPGESIDAGHMSVVLQAVLMQLSSEHRAVIMLRHFVECSYQQMAEILQIPEKTVKSRLFSARQRMRLKLLERGIA